MVGILATFAFLLTTGAQGQQNMATVDGSGIYYVAADQTVQNSTLQIMRS